VLVPSSRLLGERRGAGCDRARLRIVPYWACRSKWLALEPDPANLAGLLMVGQRGPAQGKPRAGGGCRPV